MATPALKALRRLEPKPWVAVLGRKHLFRILEDCPWIDEQIPLPKRKSWYGPVSFGKRLRERGFDTAVLLPNSFSSALMAWSARIPRRIGYRLNWRSFLLTHRLTAAREGLFRAQPMVDYYLGLTSVLGAPDDDRSLELPPREESQARVRAYLKVRGVREDEPIVALNPGAAFGSSKLWLPEHFAAVGDTYAARGARVLILAGPGEEPIAQKISSLMKRPNIDTSEEIIGLGDLCALFRRSSLVVTTDSGPRHFAVAAGALVVVVMGPTHPGYTEVDYDRYKVVLTRAPCWPCHLRRCPIDHRCMTRLTPNKVIAAGDSLLAEFGHGELL